MSLSRGRLRAIGAAVLLSCFASRADAQLPGYTGPSPGASASPLPVGVQAPGVLPGAPVAPVAPPPRSADPGAVSEQPSAPPSLGAAVNPLPVTTAKEPKFVEVGSDPTFRAFWDNGLIFETANKDWRVHLGSRFQGEGVWWVQPKRLQGPFPGNGGIPASARGDGVGQLDDGFFFRRVRLKADGTAYENFEFNIEVDFEQLNFITYDHMWVGMKNIPFLGTVRVGQMKTPQGMDNMASDYHLTFLERDVLSEGIWASLFSIGVQWSNTLFNDNVTFQTMFHRVQPVQQFFTSDYGDGNYADTTRVTWTPLYENEGSHLIHLGGSYQWRTGDLGRSIQPGGTGNVFADTQDVARFRARAELRDAVGIGNIGNGLLGGDPARFVDTGYLLTSHVQTISPEFLAIMGPFSVQSEAAWAFLGNTRSIYPTGPGGAPNLIARGSPTFWGGYVEASYFLTGEHRGYDRRFGVFDRPKVREPFFLARGEDGCLHRGLGAWQIGYRYSYLDLNDNGINGGQLSQNTFVLNWYWNDNSKIQFQYSNIQRNVSGPAVSGTVHGFGTLVQWYF